MCNFFSLVSDGNGTYLYFDWKLRKQCLSGKLGLNPDSHTSIATHFGYGGEKEDKLNKYEYNPLTKKFAVDQINTNDDSEKVKKFCKQLDFSLIVPQLIIKPITNPVKKHGKVTEEDIKSLKQWDSVRASVRDSVRDSVRASVRDSVRDSVWDSVRDSVRDSVWASVRASVRDSVGDSMWDSMWDSVWDSVGAYASSFFNLSKWGYIKHKKGVNPFQPCIDLWERGLIPSFDGTTWRLHGYKGKILWEGKI